MKIPNKISPDRIKDSFVEVKYTSKFPFEIILGKFFESLDETYNYISRPLSNQNSPNSNKFNIQGNLPLFHNDIIKIELAPSTIIFNCLDGYMSWKVYIAEIEKALVQLSKSKVIETYKRIGVRFISEYPGIDLKDCLKCSISIGVPELEGDGYILRSEIRYKEHKVILKLNNKVHIANPDGTIKDPSTPLVSIIDIDAFAEELNYKSIPDVIERMEAIHDIEKDVFFKILQETFLESLNPEY